MSRWVGALALLIVAACLTMAFGPPAPSVPSFESVRAAHRPSDAFLLDRRGELLHEIRVNDRARRLGWVRLSEISPALQAAVIASEDRRFYRHGGVDPRAIAAAAFQRLFGASRRGASTITMQVAALITPGLRRDGGPRTLALKWRQMRLAWAIEQRWSKAEILETYLNRVTFRGELQGVSAAAHVLFGKDPHGITEAEAAVLAVLLRSPNAGQALVTRRARNLLAVQQEAIGRGEIESVTAQALGSRAGTGPRVALAPHAARRIIGTMPRPNIVAQPIRTTLDSSLQEIGSDILRRHLLAARERHVQDGAILVADNETGDVLAYVGGSGDLSSAPFVDGIQAKRQAGSTLKPFLYGLALERRLLTPASLLDDAPLDISLTGGIFRPRNYDEQFKGPLTVRAALAGSVNVPAVKTLELVGLDDFVERLRLLGFESLTESGDYYGPSLALGSADVSLWELVSAYRTLANGGTWSPLRMMPGEESAAGTRAYSAQAAFLVSDILADRESRSLTFGLENPLATPFWAAVKTGTSKEMRDNWCIGFSRRYTVGVWVGNFSGAPMHDVSGVTGAAPIWADVMAWLHRGTPSLPPKPPAGLRAKTVVFPRDIERERTEWFLAGTEPYARNQMLAQGYSRILTPVQGATIAVDPDIPPGRQRVAFEYRGGGESVRWRLDEQDLGAVRDFLVWKPSPGAHTLSLIDAEGRVLDSVTFMVRGPAGTAADF